MIPSITVSSTRLTGFQLRQLVESFLEENGGEEKVSAQAARFRLRETPVKTSIRFVKN